MTEDKLE